MQLCRGGAFVLKNICLTCPVIKKWLSFRSEWCFLTDNTSGVSLSSLTVVLLVAELFLQPKTRQLLSAHAGVGNSFGCGGKR